MATLYPGKGLRLPLASSNAQEPVWASMRTATYVIPDDSYSIGVPCNAGLAYEFNVQFASAPTTDAFDVMYDVTPDFATQYILESVPATTDTVYTWTTDGIRLSGFIRIQNKGTANVNNVWVQETSATFG